MLMLPDFRVRQRDSLLEITRAITQELDLDKLLVRILRLSADLLAGQAGLIALRGTGGGWKLAAVHGVSPNLQGYLNPLLAAVPDHEDPARFEIPEINRILQKLTREASLGLLTEVGLPLIARNQVIGVIFIFRNYRGNFSNNDLILLQSFADQAAIAVQNAQLYTQTIRDKQRVDAILDSVADGMLIITPDHKIERCNPAFSRLRGQSVPEIIGHTHEEVIQWSELKHGQTLEAAEAGGWPLTPNATLYVEGDLLRPDGETLPVGVTYAPLLSNDGNLINIIASVRDITHFRQADELKSTFISVISHELKTPVAIIKGYVSTLRRDDANWDHDIIEDSLEVIEDETDRLSELIENLLDASRLEAGVLAINATDLSIPALAERLAVRFRTQTDQHTFKVDFPDSYPIILADEDRIAQVLSNLLSNAIKYSPNGGEIRISGKVAAEQIIVCVSDQGTGIAPGDMPQIFDRFYRAEDAVRKTKGAGLGLYLARALVETHKGAIWVNPEPREGTQICFSLPRQTMA
ncbi:MAG: PAS domain-containing protein [Chloroflexi bacterium]|nr:PAS domain-containing protein [Chloroflexota bacterium]